MVDPYPFIGYFSLFLAVSSYYILTKHLREQRQRESTLLANFSAMKNELQILDKRITRSTPEALTAHQDAFGIELSQSKKEISEISDSIKENTNNTENIKLELDSCKKKIKSLEQGLALVNSILEESATPEKTKPSFAFW